VVFLLCGFPQLGEQCVCLQRLRQILAVLDFPSHNFRAENTRAENTWAEDLGLKTRKLRAEKTWAWGLGLKTRKLGAEEDGFNTLAHFLQPVFFSPFSSTRSLQPWFFSPSFSIQKEVCHVVASSSAVMCHCRDFLAFI
jgi:hypothetical protein